MTKKDIYNQTRLRNIKRAKIKYLESQIKILEKEDCDYKLILAKQKEIRKLEKELHEAHSL